MRMTVFQRPAQSAKVACLLRPDEMHRSRPQSAFTLFVALMLLAQLVLTTGHSYFVGSHDPHGVALATSLGKDSNHGPKHSPEHDIDHCVLCWAQAVVGSILIPPGPEPQFPRLMLAEPLTAEVHSQITQGLCRAFQPRAPPQFAG
jgi:hypothetical protein